MSSYHQTELYNNFGYLDPTAYLGANLQVMEKSRMAERIIKYALNPNRRPRLAGVISYMSREQYITDKICMYIDDFGVRFTEDDVHELCRIASLTDLDNYFIAVLDRNWSEAGA